MENVKPGGSVLVVGSANMDMVVSCGRFPQPGETVLGADFGMYPGGKGANQAVACARLGGRVTFLGKMGRDVFCERLSAGLQRDGVSLDHLFLDPEAPTGIALITVDGEGQNEIIVVSGSNMRLTPAELEEKRAVFEAAAVVLVQLETPLETVQRAVALGKAHRATVILNPAPARPLPEALLRQVDYLTPNETEAEILTGLPVRDRASAEAAARQLLAQGVGCVVVTLGDKGALLVAPDRTALFPAQRVQAVDTTAAGDAFNGALAFALAGGQALEAALPFANAVGAYAVTKRGAQTSMPTRGELDAFTATDGYRSAGFTSQVY
jgi:ribokinase